jgi:hypothetical protein
MSHVPATEEDEFDGRRFVQRTAATGATNRRATATLRAFRYSAGSRGRADGEAAARRQLRKTVWLGRRIHAGGSIARSLIRSNAESIKKERVDVRSLLDHLRDSRAAAMPGRLLDV